MHVLIYFANDSDRLEHVSLTPFHIALGLLTFIALEMTITKIVFFFSICKLKLNSMEQCNSIIGLRAVSNIVILM